MKKVTWFLLLLLKSLWWLIKLPFKILGFFFKILWWVLKMTCKIIGAGGGFDWNGH